MVGILTEPWGKHFTAASEQKLWTASSSVNVPAVKAAMSVTDVMVIARPAERSVSYDIFEM